MTSHQRQLSGPAATILDLVSDAAEMWGAEWQPTNQGGRLRLPVVQGLRHGVVEGAVTVEPTEDGVSLHFEVDKSTFMLNKSAFAILLLGGLGGITLILWPVSTTFLRLAPIGAVLALIAWLMVVSKLRHSDPEDFFDLVTGLAEHL